MDVHKVTSTLVWRDPADRRVRRQRIFTRKAELEKALGQLARPWVVAVEATRQAPAVCRWLDKLGAEVVLVNPAKVHALAELMPGKSDRRDAGLVLQLMEAGLVPKAYLAPPEVVGRRAIGRARLKLRQVCTILRNYLRAVLPRRTWSAPIRT
jgi:transposase